MQRILIADDEEQIRMLLSDFLEKLGYDVETAENGQRALILVNHTNPDLVLLDINMPEMDGLEALHRIHEVCPDLPVIMLTGLNQDDIGKQAMENGASDFLTKPISYDQLKTNLAVHLLMSGI